MSMRLSSDEILEKVRKAFAPFHVVAELQDYHRKIGFRVYGEHDEIIGTYEGNLVEESAGSRQFEAAPCGHARRDSEQGQAFECLVI